MSGHKDFSVLRKRLDQQLQNDPQARHRVEAYRQAMRAALALTDLRESRGLTQTQLAEILAVTQENVSRLERGQDIYLSTLQRYVEALGGQLQLRAVFPDQTVDLALPKA